jgi:transcriptional regulator with XRE-family HTH domain
MAIDTHRQGSGVTVFGGLIKRLRKDRKLTLQELGDQTGLSPSFLSLVERNKAVPSIVSLVNIARAFEVSIDEFIRPAAASGVLHRHDEPDRLEIDSPIGFIRLSASLPIRSSTLSSSKSRRAPSCLARRPMESSSTIFFRVR